jgi:2'-5' RNA ligase
MIKQKSLLSYTSQELRTLTPSAYHFALWLMPCLQDHILLSEFIKKLSYHYDAPLFKPHVTIYTGVYTRHDNLPKILKRLTNTDHFSLAVKVIDFSSTLFKTLFIEFENCTRLMSLSKQLCAQLWYQTPYELIPHMSLIYKKNFPVKEKLAFMSQFELSKDRINFDKMALIQLADNAPGWQDIDSWVYASEWKLKQ